MWKFYMIFIFNFSMVFVFLNEYYEYKYIITFITNYEIKELFY